MSKIVKVQAPDGTIIKVEGPDNATDEQFIAQGQALYAQQKASPPPPPAGISAAQLRQQLPQVDKPLGGILENGGTPAEASILGVDPLTFSNRMAGAGASIINTMFPGGDTPRPNATLPPMTPDQEIGAKTAALAAGAQGTQALAKALARRLPSTVRAGQTFQTVMGAAKDVPLDLSATAPVVERAQDISKAGGPALPKVFRDFVKNRAAADITPISDYQPMTYEVGRDFASNAGNQSVKAVNAQNAAMQRQVAQFADAMKTANREAAAKVGMGELYDSAMKEYRQAKNLGKAKDVLKKYAGMAAMAAAIGAGGAKIGYDLFTK